MVIEKIRVLKTLKLGSNVFQEGKVLNKPFPPEILRELNVKSGTLEAIEAEEVVAPPVETQETPKPDAEKPKAPKPKKEATKPKATKAKKLVPRGK